MPQHPLNSIEATVSQETHLVVWAQAWAQTMQAPLWVGLEGPLGAGKTTFVRALLRHLGVTQPITSPTYPLLNTYTRPNGQPVVHADWYRLHDEGDLENIGWRDLLTSETLGFVEWPDRLPHAAQALCDIRCVWNHENGQRTVRCTAHTQGGNLCLDGVKALWDAASLP